MEIIRQRLVRPELQSAASQRSADVRQNNN